MDKQAEIRVGSVWVRNKATLSGVGSPGRFLGMHATVTDVGGRGEVSYTYASGDKTAGRPQEAFRAMFDPLHDTSSPYMPKDTLGCVKCGQLWAASLTAPPTCDPVDDAHVRLDKEVRKLTRKHELAQLCRCEDCEPDRVSKLLADFRGDTDPSPTGLGGAVFSSWNGRGR